MEKAAEIRCRSGQKTVGFFISLQNVCLVLQMKMLIIQIKLSLKVGISKISVKNFCTMGLYSQL